MNKPMTFHFRNLGMVLLCAISIMLSACSKDEPDTPGDKNIAADFDRDFAAELQKRGYVADAANISIKDVENIKELDVSFTYDNPGHLKSLKGIEYFKSLTDLYCSRNQLTTLDVAKLTKLQTLFCDYNQLATLDVSKLTQLQFLHCGDNQLTTLEVANLAQLRVLHCDYNQFTKLDVGNLTQLHLFTCGGNQLTTLEIGNLTQLQLLGCNNNKISTLDVSNLAQLQYFGCWNNLLTKLDISKNTALEEFYTDSNPGVSGKFMVKCSFPPSSIPANFTTGSWSFNNETVQIVYYN